MKLQCKSADPRDLADAVYRAMNRKAFGWRRRNRKLSGVVTPLVLESCAGHGLYDCTAESMALPSHRAFCCRIAAIEVKAGLGIIQYILWSWVLPLVIEWLVNWYFSADGAAMRDRHRAESEATQ